MPLAPGTLFGEFEIRSALGAGAMGEVYRGLDRKLNRNVAIKLLRRELAGDASHLARLKREAQLLASLNHPHIAAIYGLAESDGTHALVLELVEGDSLAARLAGGALSIEQALSIARQIAEALAAAHERGIVHRDLKPANVKLRDDGVVKVLDFGIAKSVPPPGDHDPSAPTITAAALTTPGGMVGTPAYMAPEQVSGRSADKRCDIWAFGCVLFEMLTGRRAFEGREIADVLAAVLTRDPDWSLLPPQLPPSIRALLRRCVARDPHARLGDLAAALFVLEEQAALATGDAPPFADRDKRPRRGAWARFAVPGAMLLTAVLAGGAVWLLTRTPPPRVTRSALVMAPSAAPSFADPADVNVDIAPDGSWVAYVGNDATQLFVRALDAIQPTAIVTTPAYLRGVFVSDDGLWLGYVENNFTLRKVSVAGGAPATVVAMDGPSRGAAWSSERGIVFATATVDTGLQRVDPSGGSVTVLTKPDAGRGEGDHLFPAFLPDDRHVLFTILPASDVLDASQIGVLDLETGAWRAILEGGYHGRYVTSGHLLYASGGALRAVGFDPSRLETRGASVQVAPNLVTSEWGAAVFDVAGDGTLIYADAPGGVSSDLTPVWVDRDGRETTLDLRAATYRTPRISPDGTRLAVSDGDLWIVDLAHPTAEPTRLTFAREMDWFPVWTPDGRRLVFGSWRGGAFSNLFVQSVEGGTAERLTTSPDGQLPTSITPDGTSVVFNQLEVGLDRFNLQRVQLAPPRTVETLLATPYVEHNGEVSPDGRWLAYEGEHAARPGQLDVYVRPLPDVNAGQWQVSPAGGIQPVWARDGSELFYRDRDGAVMVARVAAKGGSFSTEKPVRLFQGPYLTRSGNLGRSYDVSPDGRRFLMLKERAVDPTLAPPHLVVVQHLDRELKRLTP
jgi:serine/threonine-protein kinase